MTWLAAAGWWGFGLLCGTLLWHRFYRREWRRLSERYAMLERYERIALGMDTAPRHTVNGNARRPGA